MDIRIGNDIQVSIPLSLFGNIVEKDVIFATCTFVKKGETDDTKYECCPNSIHNLSQYTIHGCGIPAYNVKPSNSVGFAMHKESHNCEFFVCTDGVNHHKHVNFVNKCKIQNGNLIGYFPAEFLVKEGNYNCFFDIKVCESNWDNDGLHSYRYGYTNLFALTNKDSGKTGLITIDPQQDKSIDTYLLCITDSDLIVLNGNYSNVISKTNGFNLNSPDSQNKTIHIIGENNRIVLFSKYPTIQIKYNDFAFPMNMYLLDNNYYMYVSKYTYTNCEMTLNIVDSDKKNKVIKTNPYINKDIIYNSLNILDGTNLRLFGDIQSDALITSGKVNNTVLSFLLWYVAIIN